MFELLLQCLIHLAHGTPWALNLELALVKLVLQCEMFY